MFATVLLTTAPFLLGALAQSSSSSLASASASGSNAAPAATTLNLFLDTWPNQTFVGSVVNADADETTIAVVCTEGQYGYASYMNSSLNIVSPTCDGQTTVSHTFRGSSVYSYVSDVDAATIDGGDGELELTDRCTLEPSSLAVCSIQVSISFYGEATQTQSITTYEGAEATSKWFQVPITGGAEKLPAATSSVAVQSGNAAAPTGLTDLYKVVVVPAAALLAGAAAL